MSMNIQQYKSEHIKLLKAAAIVVEDRDALLQRLAEKDAEIERLKGLVVGADSLFRHHKRGVQSLEHEEFKTLRDEWLEKAKGVV